MFGGFYGALPTPVPEAPTGPTWCGLRFGHDGPCERVTAAALLDRHPDGRIADAGRCGLGDDGWRCTALVPARIRQRR